VPWAAAPIAVASRSPGTSSTPTLRVGTRVLLEWIFTLVLLSSPIGMATVLPGVLEEEDCGGTSICLAANVSPRTGLGPQRFYGNLYGRRPPRQTSRPSPRARHDPPRTALPAPPLPPRTPPL